MSKKNKLVNRDWTKRQEARFVLKLIAKHEEHIMSKRSVDIPLNKIEFVEDVLVIGGVVFRHKFFEKHKLGFKKEVQIVRAWFEADSQDKVWFNIVTKWLAH